MKEYFNKLWKFLRIPLLIIVLGIILNTCITELNNTTLRSSAKIISYQSLLDKVKAGEIYEIQVNGNELYAFSKSISITNTSIIASVSTISTTNNKSGLSHNEGTNLTFNISDNIDGFIQQKNTGALKLTIKTYRIKSIYDTKELTELLYKDTHNNINVHDPNINAGVYFWFWYLAIIFIIGYFYIKYNNKKNPHIVDSSNTDNKEDIITFKDVAGEDEAKESLQEIVDFLHNSKKYTKIGAKCPKGALMVGPPGSGKTLLAKAIAGEAKVPFLFKSASEFVEMYVGVGAKRVRELFDEAKRCAPCVVFIDEIDCVGGQRGVYTGGTGGGDSERDQTINQLLTEMDGFGSNKGIVVIAATNRPEMLDQALKRPGRFDRQIVVDKPDLIGREEILKVHCKKVQLDKNVNLHEIALMTTGCVGADLANIINCACIIAVKRGKEKVEQKDLIKAIDECLVGKEKKNQILTPQEKKIVSYHEAGHAVIGRLQTGATTIKKISIIPVTNGALGYVMQNPAEEKHLQSKKELYTEIRTLLAGRATEELIFGKENITNGASNDLEKATDLIKSMYTIYGMGKNGGLYSTYKQKEKYINNGGNINCSQYFYYEIDKEIKITLNKLYIETKKLISTNIKFIHKIAKTLLENEKITEKEFNKIYNNFYNNKDKNEKRTSK